MIELCTQQLSMYMCVCICGNPGGINCTMVCMGEWFNAFFHNVNNWKWLLDYNLPWFQDVLQLIKEVSETISVELSEKELRDGTRQQLTERAVVICLFGRFNSGKSTMINAILGNE